MSLPAHHRRSRGYSWSRSDYGRSLGRSDHHSTSHSFTMPQTQFKKSRYAERKIPNSICHPQPEDHAGRRSVSLEDYSRESHRASMTFSLSLSHQARRAFEDFWIARALTSKRKRRGAHSAASSGCCLASCHRGGFCNCYSGTRSCSRSNSLRSGRSQCDGFGRRRCGQRRGIRDRCRSSLGNRRTYD